MNKIKVKSIVALVLLFSLCMCFVWGARASGKRLYYRTTYSEDVRAYRKKIYGGGQWQTDGL